MIVKCASRKCGAETLLDEDQLNRLLLEGDIIIACKSCGDFIFIIAMDKFSRDGEEQKDIFIFWVKKQEGGEGHVSQNFLQQT